MSGLHVAGPTHAKNTRKSKKIILTLAAFLIAIFMILEFLGGIISNSIALISDSAHMLSDLISLIMGISAIIIASKVNNNQKTYGYSRFEIVISFANALFLIFICGLITYEAIWRFLSPPEVDIKVMLPIAVSGLIINLIVFFMVLSTKGHDHNHCNHNIHSPSTPVSNILLTGIMLHVLSDLLGSLAAIGSGIIIYYTSWLYIDPILSIFIVLLLLNSSWRVLRETTDILMEGTPKNINIANLAEEIVHNVPNVLNVHHIHLWMLNEYENIITLHIILKDYRKTYEVIENIKIFLKEKYDILHSTIQVEKEPGHCLDREEESHH